MLHDNLKDNKFVYLNLFAQLSTNLFIPHIPYMFSAVLWGSLLSFFFVLFSVCLCVTTLKAKIEAVIFKVYAKSAYTSVHSFIHETRWR